MPEGAGEGQPHPAHKPEVKHAIGTHHPIDSAATPRQEITESEESKELTFPYRDFSKNGC